MIGTPSSSPQSASIGFQRRNRAAWEYQDGEWLATPATTRSAVTPETVLSASVALPAVARLIAAQESEMELPVTGIPPALSSTSMP
jgi:hypothetical protein